jgi:hypothetical protein
MDFNFKGPGLGTEAGARARLAKVAGLTKQSKTFVAIQNDRYYPVVVINPDDMWNARHIVDCGIFVLN